MQYYCDQSENSRLIVDRFIETLDGVEQLFLGGASGSEFELLIKEYCSRKQIDDRAIVSVQPSMLDESILSDLILILSRMSVRPELILVQLNQNLDLVTETILLKFLNNPALNECKMVVTMDGYDPFEEGEELYSESLTDRSKECLFVLPPLKNRVADLGYFAVDLLLTLSTKRHLKTPLRLSPDALQLLISYDWPGNYEELKDVLRVLVDGSDRGGLIPRDRLLEVLNLSRTVPVE